MYITPRATDIEALYIINTRYFCASKKRAAWARNGTVSYFLVLIYTAVFLTFILFF